MPYPIQTTGCIACVIQRLAEPRFLDILKGIISVFKKTALTIQFIESNSKANWLLPSNLVGMLIVASNPSAQPFRLPEGVPRVFIGTNQGYIGSLITLDDIEIGLQATTHLQMRGHVQIATITGPLSEQVAANRQLGYLTAVQQAKNPIIIDNIYEGDWLAQSGTQALLHWARQGKRPRAIFAHNDAMALGAIYAAHQLGLHIPKDLAIIGVGDEPFSAYIDPSLTTISQNFVQAGELAANQLLQHIADPNLPPQLMRLAAHLIERHST